MKESLAKQFLIDEDFNIKFMNEDGSHLELTGTNFEQIKELGTMNKIRLEIELLDQQPDPSNYDKDEFEED